MAGGWVKSLHCKSRAFNDVHHGQYQKRLLSSTSSSSSSSASSFSLIYSFGCRKSAQTIKDHHRHRQAAATQEARPLPALAPAPAPRLPQRTAAKVEEARRGATPRARTSSAAEPAYPALTELLEGHPSCNVVEIIFHTSWGPKPSAGRVDVILKVQNGQRTTARFEEYRELVKSRAESGGPRDEDSRCAADGNEVMWFRRMGSMACEGPTWDCGRVWGFKAAAAAGSKGAAIYTFDGGGCAHESAGGGRGRRAMLVCRVIAGQASKKLGLDHPFPGCGGGVTYNSVSRDDIELLVFDPRAVLACFLIIYRL